VTTVVEELLAEAGFPGDGGLAGLLGELEAMADGPAPRPSDALAALLAGSVTALPVTSVRRRLVSGAAALTVVAVTTTGFAAAANELPARAQRIAASFSTHFLPFSFPMPREDGPLTPGLPLRPRPHPAARPAGQATALPATIHAAARTTGTVGAQDGTGTSTRDHSGSDDRSGSDTSRLGDDDRSGSPGTDGRSGDDGSGSGERTGSSGSGDGQETGDRSGGDDRSSDVGDTSGSTGDGSGSGSGSGSDDGHDGSGSDDGSGGGSGGGDD